MRMGAVKSELTRCKRKEQGYKFANLVDIWNACARIHQIARVLHCWCSFISFVVQLWWSVEIRISSVFVIFCFDLIMEPLANHCGDKIYLMGSVSWCQIHRGVRAPCWYGFRIDPRPPIRGHGVADGRSLAASSTGVARQLHFCFGRLISLTCGRLGQPVCLHFDFSLVVIVSQCFSNKRSNITRLLFSESSISFRVHFKFPMRLYAFFVLSFWSKIATFYTYVRAKRRRIFASF